MRLTQCDAYVNSILHCVVKRAYFGKAQNLPKVMHFPFFSNPSPIIGHPCHSLTDSLPFSRLDVTLTGDDANSKLVDVATVADADDEDRVGNSLLQI